MNQRLRNCGEAHPVRLALFDLVLDDDAQAVLLFNQDCVALFGDQSQRGCKAIAALGNSLDVLLLLAIVAQRPARGGNILREVVLFHEDIRPDNLD